MLTPQMSTSQPPKCQPPPPYNPSDIRLMKDFQEIHELLPDVKIIFPNPSTNREFHVFISPDRGFWHRGKFEFKFVVTRKWPEDRPKIKCLTKVWHPSITEEGFVDLGNIQTNYYPTTTICQIICYILFLFHEPNFDYWFNPQSEQFKRDPEGFKLKVDEYIEKYCPK